MFSELPQSMLVMRHFCIATVLSLWIKLSVLTDVLFILPNNLSNTSCPSQPCATLSQHLLDNNGTLPVVENVEYHLFPGEHLIPSNVKLYGLHNFTFVGVTKKYSPPVYIVNCLQSFLEITNSRYFVIRNIIFKQCQDSQTYQQYSNIETNLFLHFCWSCTIENVTFLKYGLIGLNICGISLFKNVVINLTIESTSTYMNYHGIMLAYHSSPSLSFDSVCTFSGVSISGHVNKVIPNNIQNSLCMGNNYKDKSDKLSFCYRNKKFSIL